MSEMDQFLADLYQTGKSYNEKVAAEQEKIAADLQEMDKMAALESFKDAVQSTGLNVDEYNDEALAGMFEEYYALHKQASAESVPQESDDELVKRAWAEADAYGREVARAEFIDFVKSAAAKDLPAKFVRALTGKGVQTYKEPVKALESKIKSPLRGAMAGKPLPAEAEKLKSLKKALTKEQAKQVGAWLATGGAAAAPAATAAAAGAGAGYAAGKEKKGSDEGAEQQPEQQSEYPFLESEIQKRAMLLAYNAGMITPEGELNIKEGQYIKDPSEWAGQIDTSAKTAFDQNVHVMALHHLEALGYPINWEE